MESNICPLCRESHEPSRGFSFDGKGINLCDAYRTRIATLSPHREHIAAGESIVRAVNSHAELVAALRAICDYCNVKQAKPGDSYNIPADGTLLANARAALAKATA